MNDQNDHDLLIEMRTEMKAVREDIKDIKDNTTARVTALEKRVSGLERLVYIGFGILLAIEFYIIYIHK